MVDRADRADTLYGVAGISQGVALLATMVVYLCWLWRVRVNAEVFDASRHRMKRGWTIGGWFCPIVNLVVPRAGSSRTAGTPALPGTSAPGTPR
ncbi:DUF4328 domain-containing protein [Streptomyces tricolor]|nr:DUF4328 domain-containing protein [Streptomyces tricolor]